MMFALWSAFAVLVAAIGYRTQMLPLGAAFPLLGVGLLGSVVAVGLYALRMGMMLVRQQPGRIGVTAAGLVIGLVVLAIPGSVIVSARRHANGLPAIHDISTDTDDPPAVVEVLPLRASAPNTTAYGGPAVAAQQRSAFPDLGPVTLPGPPSHAFDIALAAVSNMKWTLVGSSREQGRIEATDTTFWFGFKDDIVVRLRPAAGGTRVDVRSVSRVGGGDVGTNAKRIRAYLSVLSTLKEK